MASVETLSSSAGCTHAVFSALAACSGCALGSSLILTQRSSMRLERYAWLCWSLSCMASFWSASLPSSLASRDLTACWRDRSAAPACPRCSADWELPRLEIRSSREAWRARPRSRWSCLAPVATSSSLRCCSARRPSEELAREPKSATASSSLCDSCRSSCSHFASAARTSSICRASSCCMRRKSFFMSLPPASRHSCISASCSIKPSCTPGCPAAAAAPGRRSPTAAPAAAASSAPPSPAGQGCDARTSTIRRAHAVGPSWARS
mmetsp:Transcript_8353/g.23532  ORF Transcript_8353/g.23532 Transcript_8353/m.23532 type:complete len:265 (+) Transcript_8353:844-1638(+)